jgi:hypothetical protein
VRGTSPQESGEFASGGGSRFEFGDQRVHRFHIFCAVI